MRTLADGLDCLRIIIIDLRVFDPSGQKHYPGDLGLLSKCARELQNILGLTAGIGVPAELQIVAADQPMNAD